MFDTVIVRFGGEIGIKAPFTRKQYERRLNSNIRASLKHHAVPYSVFSRIPGRLYIRTNRAKETARLLSKVFGISSLSPAFTTSSDLDEILDASTRLARRRFKRGESFAVRCHRVGKHSYTSQEVCARIGEHILSSLHEFKLKVDLTRPERTMHVEIRDRKAYFFTDVIKGPGGLPLGTQPKLVCLLKDDLRSAVACWMTMKRGCPQVLVNVNTNLSSLREAKRPLIIAAALAEWSIGFPARLHIAHCRLNLKRTLEKHPPELVLLVRRRLMFRIAQRIAETTKAEGMVTGDSFGKNRAHSLHAFRILDEAVRGLPVYRPLLGLDDYETALTAERIGFEKTTTKKVEESDTKTTVELGRIRKIEQGLDVDRIIDNTVKSIRTVELARLDQAKS